MTTAHIYSAWFKCPGSVVRLARWISGVDMTEAEALDYMVDYVSISNGT